MCHEILKCRATLYITMVAIAMSMAGPVFGSNYFWTGAVSTNAADPNNWLLDQGAPTLGTLPGNDDTVRIGCTTDYTKQIENVNQLVLTSEWVSRAGNAYAGWWLLMGTTGIDSQNSLTVGEGAYIEWSHNDGTLRNGTTLRVTGQRTGGGPSMVIAPRFRIGNNGDIVPTATSTVIVETNGYLQFNPDVSHKGSGGQDIYMGSATKALVEIRDNGILELVTKSDGSVIPRFNFASADPELNKIVISGKGQLRLTGDTAAIAQVAGASASLQSLIDTGLITTANEDETLVYSGTNPTVVKLAGQRISNPKPADGESNVDRYVSLSWDAGTMADKYDVYFGADATVVSEATRANPSGVLQSQDQAETYYPLNGVLTLEYGQTYYWRVDEVVTAPSQTILKGKVWSFTLEPFVIPIPAESITATASGQSPDQGPEKTIDRSGLDANDLHSTVLTDMWLSDTTKPVWIEYTFDQVYKIRQMLVWNYNGEEILTVLGLKDVTIEYSADGVAWTQLTGVSTFAQAPGTPDYAADTIVDFGDVAAKKVRITAQSNWGNSPIFNKYGLSEVRFLHIPVAARQPSPKSGATDVEIDGVLSWRAGREAAEHKVYLSTDQQAVADGTVAAATVHQASYSPSSLILGTTYFWRVDEVNEAETPAIWPSGIWTFTTADRVVVDDFESYGDDSPNRVFQAWIDGAGFSPDEFFPNGNQGNGTGSLVGHDPTMGHIMEYTIIHGGRQSMPLTYDGLSEATRTFDPAQDWTRGGIQTLVLFFQGAPSNVPGELYVKINNTKVSYGGSTDDLAAPEWKQWNIALPSGAGLGAVNTLTIGVASGQGMLYIDDIGLYRSAPAVNP
jgi:hypothetical protein